MGPQGIINKTHGERTMNVFSTLAKLLNLNLPEVNAVLMGQEFLCDVEMFKFLLNLRVLFIFRIDM